MSLTPPDPAALAQLQSRLLDHADAIGLECIAQSDIRPRVIVPERGHCWACNAALDIRAAATALDQHAATVRALEETCLGLVEKWRKDAEKYNHDCDEANGEPRAGRLYGQSLGMSWAANNLENLLRERAK